MRYFIIFLGLLLLPAGDIRAGEDGALEIIPETADTMKTPVPVAAPEIVGDTIAPVVKTAPVKIRVPKKSIKKADQLQVVNIRGRFSQTAQRSI